MPRPTRLILELAMLEAVHRARFELKNRKTTDPEVSVEAMSGIENVFMSRGYRPGEFKDDYTPVWSAPVKALIIKMTAEAVLQARKLGPGGYYCQCPDCEGDGNVTLTFRTTEGCKRGKTREVTDETTCVKCYGSGSVWSPTPVEEEA